MIPWSCAAWFDRVRSIRSRKKCRKDVSTRERSGKKSSWLSFKRPTFLRRYSQGTLFAVRHGHVSSDWLFCMLGRGGPLRSLWNVNKNSAKQNQTVHSVSDNDWRRNSQWNAPRSTETHAKRRKFNIKVFKNCWLLFPNFLSTDLINVKLPIYIRIPLQLCSLMF